MRLILQVCNAQTPLDEENRGLEGSLSFPKVYYNFCQANTSVGNNNKKNSAFETNEKMLLPFFPVLRLLFKKIHKLHTSKGQIISKVLFVVLEFSQKTNERIRRSSKNELVHSFLGEFEDTKSPFEIIWPLVEQDTIDYVSTAYFE